jgi:UDP-2,3-diacylglucosamine pyrophosphatase LpxH
MAAARPDVADLLDVRIPTGGRVVAISDLHLPPERSDISGRSCALVAARLAELAGPGTAALTVVLAGDIIELLANPQASADAILREHEDLCAALAAVVAAGGQVVYAVGNHDSDLAWDVKAADAVRERTGARLCLAADLVLPDGSKVRVEHGHQLDPYNCFCDPRNRLDTPLGHHIVREVLPRIEFLGRGWLDGAHEMADPGDFPSFVGSRLFYRKLTRHAWWLLLIPVLLLLALRVSEILSLPTKYPDTTRWVHGAEILGYGAVADLIVVAAIIAIVSRRAWTSISALALAERGYGQNHAARQRAADLTGEGYRGFLSGHTHHPELSPCGAGFYGNTGSCTTVVEGTATRLTMPSAYLRAQQICWLELTSQAAGLGAEPGAGLGAELRVARVDLPGATRLERFAARGRHRFSASPAVVGSWPGPAWPAAAVAAKAEAAITTGRSTSADAGEAAGPERP